jgi:hypothetical protein
MTQSQPSKSTNNDQSEPELDWNSFVKHRGILLPRSAVLPLRVRVLRSLPQKVCSIPVALWRWTGFKENWTGFQDKKLWDVLKLLVVPIVLAFATLYIQETSKRRDLQIADDRAKQEVLNRYFDQISALLFERKLRTAKEGDEARIVARARTLTALRTLDGERKGQLVRFLVEAKLVEAPKPTIDLASADLRKANLASAELTGVNLSRVDLSGANLSGTVISAKTAFNGANLSDADLTRMSFIVDASSGPSLFTNVSDGTEFKDALLCHTAMPKLIMSEGVPNGTINDRDCDKLKQRGQP